MVSIPRKQHIMTPATCIAHQYRYTNNNFPKMATMSANAPSNKSALATQIHPIGSVSRY